jgi:hypothetical protein
MPQKAHITSIEAIEQFRSQLIIYINKARPTLEEVSGDVLRLRSWLENDQRIFWENQFRRRSKDLEEAQAALFSARLGLIRKETSVEVMMVQRCKRTVDEAEEKLRVIKRWHREFDGRIQPLLMQTEKLHTVLSNDLIKALAYLNEVIKTLAAYAEAGPRLEAEAPVPGPAVEASAPLPPDPKITPSPSL